MSSTGRITQYLQQPMHIAPLVSFRILMGALMFLGTLRFLWLGWVQVQYVEPVMHFRYFGFGWVPVLPAFWLYAIHIALLVASIGVMLGACYRISAWVLFLGFTYLELIDISYYLNHYYFMSIVLGLLACLPAHRWYSVDAARRGIHSQWVPRLYIGAFRLLLAVVYTYAGLAKINDDWLLHALPLKIWLPAQDAVPVLGPLFAWKYAPMLFSWAGMLYDCSIAFFLWCAPTRLWAYGTVWAFHILTGILFQIGMFPVVMIAATTIFFSERWHLRVLTRVWRFRQWIPGLRMAAHRTVGAPFAKAPRYTLAFMALFFTFQLLFPWRYLLYPGNLFWTEEGYRFAWRVMLMEKAGTATFYVRDSATGREGVVVNSEFLNHHQEKQMAMQPDMILQFAHFLHRHYSALGMHDPVVRSEVYVTLNARPSALLIDPQVNLAAQRDTWRPKAWVLPAPR